MSGIPVALLIAGAVIALALGTLLSAGEAALARFTRAAAEDLAQEGRRGAARVQALADRRDSALASLALVRVAVDMIVAVLTTLAVAGLVQRWWLVLIVSLLANILLLGVVVGLSPRTYGRRNPATTLLTLGPLLAWVDALVSPWHRLAARRRRDAAPTDAEAREAVNEDLREMIDEIGESESIEDEDRQMMRSVVELGQTLVREVMVPRTDMVTIDAAKPASAAMRLFVRSGYSRVPVIGEDADDVRGILYLKDVLRRLAAHPEHEDHPVASFVREAEYVPETKLADDLLREMQTGRFHMALAVDEYGGTAGLITMEDLLEEVVGELTDEHDPELPEVAQVAPGRYRVPARLALDELGALFDLEIEDDDVETAGGLLTKAIGRVPLPGATGDIQGLRLQAEDVAGRRRQVSTLIASRTPDHDKDTDD
ncbi:hemolysin family protein [Actinomyces slackii]|uniref:Magnesium and cobalt efflux protein CorC n=1 Tax=Actinomyces slackii TaxID=52774 RepID=A0A3S4WKQ1_9ACTO|nr:hemolysin family protein [Actinomyces slackii]VEG75007.1 Magnesium and cobalt efflux protein CorC [Actinomyces slackii]